MKKISINSISAYYHDDDKDGGFSASIQDMDAAAYTKACKMFSVALKEYNESEECLSDKDKMAADLEAQLKESGRNKLEKNTTLFMMINVYWLEQNGYLKPDNFNGMQFISFGKEVSQ